MVQNIDLTFLVNIDCDYSLAEFISLFKTELSEANIAWNATYTVGHTTDNWLDILKNPAYDPALTNADEGWFYYKFTLGVYSKHKSPTSADVENQISFIRLIKAALNKLGCQMHFSGDSLLSNE